MALAMTKVNDVLYKSMMFCYCVYSCSYGYHALAQSNGSELSQQENVSNVFGDQDIWDKDANTKSKNWGRSWDEYVYHLFVLKIVIDLYTF